MDCHPLSTFFTRSPKEWSWESWAPIAIGLESQGLLPQRDVMARQARSQRSQRFNLWTCRIRRIGCSVSAWKLWLEPNCLACGSRNCTVGLQCQIGWTNLDVPKPSKSKGPHQKSPHKAKENERNTNITWEFRRSWQSLWMRSFTLRWSAAKGRVTLYQIKKGLRTTELLLVPSSIDSWIELIVSKGVIFHFGDSRQIKVPWLT